MILLLNTLKTDYFRDDAYPTYLLFNPYPADTLITLQLGTGVYDLYEAVNNNFVAYGVSGSTQINIPADQAVLVVLTPPGGIVSYDLEKMRVDGVVVDYHAGVIVPNYPPRVKSLIADPELVLLGQDASVFCTAVDRELGSLTYSWSASGGQISGSGSNIIWTAPTLAGLYEVECIVTDMQMASDTATVQITVVEQINNPPVIGSLTAQPGKIDLGGSSRLTCAASDPDGDTLAYTWSANSGTLLDSGMVAIWTAPSLSGDYYVSCRVDDGNGGQDLDSIGVVVRDFSIVQTGRLVAFYPFNGDASDASGNGHHGTVSGAILVADRFGNPGSAYSFDGLNDYIRIPNHDSLNFQQAMTVNFWLRVDQFYTREAFPLSHGSWENRWKTSIIPDRKLRWTIKTNHPVNNGIIDLDTRTILNLNIWYNVTLYYDGTDFDVYLDGNLDNFGHWAGLIRTTTYDMTVAQMLPNNSSYNFNGVIDDIRIFNYGLPLEDIENLASIGSGIGSPEPGMLPNSISLHQNYPNPFNPVTTITFGLPITSQVSLTVYDITGRKIAALVEKKIPAGIHQVSWDASRFASGIYFYQLQADGVRITRKMILMQ